MPNRHPWAEKLYSPKCIRLQFSRQDIEELLLEIPREDAIAVICEVIAHDKQFVDEIKKWINTL